MARWLAGVPRKRPGMPELTPQTALTVTSMNILAALLIGFLLQVTIVGTLAHNRDQAVAYDDLRLSLAEGTTPVGPVDGVPLKKGAPIARITIPTIGVKEVVLAGTTSGVLRGGIGQRRDTVLPGQAGTSILMGHRMAHGGPFSRLDDLVVGDPIDVVTGQGPAQFRVTAVRRPGDLQIGPASGVARLTLVTSTGSRFAPSEILRVDADMTTAAFPTATPAFTAATLPADERFMAGEHRALGGALLWGLLLLAAAIGSVWLRLCWGRWQSWLISVPTLAYLGVSMADQVSRLLPNLL
jgi:LPXTG-site transpeptidase (sortase) family protein